MAIAQLPWHPSEAFWPIYIIHTIKCCLSMGFQTYLPNIGHILKPCVQIIYLRNLIILKEYKVWSKKTAFCNVENAKQGNNIKKHRKYLSKFSALSALSTLSALSALKKSCKLWFFAKIVEFGENFEIRSKLWNLLKIVKFGQHSEISSKLSNLVWLVKFGMVWYGLVWFGRNSEAACRFREVMCGFREVMCGFWEVIWVGGFKIRWVGRTDG